jgi:nucleotide-binding universal stress UspA family protein
LEYAAKNHVDLIIMTSHGRSGISRWLFGSVAERVSQHSTIPVLIVAPAGCRDENPAEPKK